MAQSYNLYLVRTVNGKITSDQLGTYKNLDKAIIAAKKAAHTRNGGVKYGPSSLAYVGADQTAVVSW